jgi:predicted AAA+ superfamily ATPase
MYKRAFLKTLTKRILEPRLFIQVIFGPRQVGKTTLVIQMLKQTRLPNLYETADAVAMDHSLWISQVWERARMLMKAAGAPEFLLIIDEIQKIENWSEYVKREWDQDTREHLNIKVVLLGSARMLLQKGLTESMAGRFEINYLGHWSLAEMQDAFGWDVSQYIYYGGYPGAVQLIKDENRWKNYIKDALIETSISKDILMLTRIDKPALLKRLFELGTLYSGQILSFTKIMGQLQDAGNSTTLSHYLQLLSECWLLGGLEKYSGEIIRKRSSSPKFQVYNNALLSAQMNNTFKNLVVMPDKWGRLVESTVGAHLINNAVTGKYTVSYWREGGSEVDFVLEKEGKTIGLEVKSGAKGGTSGMKAFHEKFRPNKLMLVGTGGIPYQEFLKMDPIELF